MSIEINIKPELCINNPDTDAFCLTSRNTTQLLSFNFLVTLSNQQRFVDDHYGGSPIVSEAKLDWFRIPVVPKIREFEIH